MSMAYQQKLTEKLTIFNDRGRGVLLRMNYIRVASATIPDGQDHGSVCQIHQVMTTMSSYYDSFIDVMEFRAMNFDFTNTYLELIVTYTSIIVMLLRIDDMKVLVSMYNCAHEMPNGNSDPAYPCLAQMFLEYDQPMKKLTEEFGAHTKAATGVFEAPLRSMFTVSLWALWLSTLGFLLHHSSLNTNQSSQELWKTALCSGLYLNIIRDETLNIHKFPVRCSKRVANIKECREHALVNSGAMHGERRGFLRNALKELVKVLEDEPGLLGLKVLWLVRHSDNIPRIKTPEDYIDS
ncbi:unnamed protein product [Coregonus sp. 'balchen']|nr:unnamed protein product [Coregonus sp. 'balchen']